jgi:hypothetical protein
MIADRSTLGNSVIVDSPEKWFGPPHAVMIIAENWSWRRGAARRRGGTRPRWTGLRKFVRHTLPRAYPTE